MKKEELALIILNIMVFFLVAPYIYDITEMQMIINATIATMVQSMVNLTIIEGYEHITKSKI